MNKLDRWIVSLMWLGRGVAKRLSCHWLSFVNVDISDFLICFLNIHSKHVLIFLSLVEKVLNLMLSR